MLSKPEKSQIKMMMQSPQWGVFERLIQEIINKYRDDFGARDTEWETIRHTLITEGKIRGLTDFLKEIYLHASQNE